MTYYQNMEKVNLNKVRKYLKKFPIHIIRNLQRWALQVETIGISEVRKIPGYHDEPLTGTRKGQRSIRLSKHYRLFYIEVEENHIKQIIVEEMNKHDY